MENIELARKDLDSFKKLVQKSLLDPKDVIVQTIRENDFELFKKIFHLRNIFNCNMIKVAIDNEDRRYLEHLIKRMLKTKRFFDILSDWAKLDILRWNILVEFIFDNKLLKEDQIITFTIQLFESSEYENIKSFLDSKYCPNLENFNPENFKYIDDHEIQDLLMQYGGHKMVQKFFDALVCSCYSEEIEKFIQEYENDINHQFDVKYYADQIFGNNEFHDDPDRLDYLLNFCKIIKILAKYNFTFINIDQNKIMSKLLDTFKILCQNV